MDVAKDEVRDYKHRYRRRKRYAANPEFDGRRSNKRSEKSSYWHTFLDLLFFLLCSIGFLYQVSTISSSYFGYATTTLTTIDMPEMLFPPDMSLCVRYVDLLSPESIREVCGKDVLTNTSKGIQMIQDAITIRQIFNMTPDPENLLEFCFLPQLQSYHVFEGEAEDCIREVSGDKYYVQEYICYHFKIRGAEHKMYSYENQAYALSFPGLFYGIFLNLTQMEGADSIKTVIHEKDTLPYESMGYAPVFGRFINNDQKYNMIKAAYQVTEIDLLGPPFETNCRTYKEFDSLQSLCVQKCLDNLTRKEFGEVSFSAIQDTGVPLKHISNKDVSDRKVSAKLHEIDTRCFTICDQPACETEHYSTFLQIEEESDMEFFAVVVQAPTLPAINVTSGQKMTLSDFLVYITSTCGTWFGISALSFSPLTLKSHLRKREKKCICLFCRKSFFQLKRKMMQLETLRKNRNFM